MFRHPRKEMRVKWPKQRQCHYLPILLGWHYGVFWLWQELCLTSSSNLGLLISGSAAEEYKELAIGLGHQCKHLTPRQNQTRWLAIHRSGTVVMVPRGQEYRFLKSQCMTASKHTRTVSNAFAMRFNWATRAFIANAIPGDFACIWS